MLESYNLLINTLKSFDDFGTEYNEETDTVIDTYNSFPCSTTTDRSRYEEHLQSLYEKSFFEIKRTIDNFLITTDGTELTCIFLKSKLNDFQNLLGIIKKRDDKITKDKIKYAFYDEIEDDFLRNMERELFLLKRGEELYYRNSITLHDLIAEDEFSTFVSMNSLKTLVSHISIEKYQRDLIKKIYTQLQELEKVYLPSQKEVKQERLATTKVEKDFRSYLHHDNKEALMEKLHELLDNEKGKVVAITIKALEKIGCIAVLSQRAALYRSMENEFGYIGAPTGLNNYYNNLSSIDTKNLKLKQLNEELQQQIDILSRVK